MTPTAGTTTPTTEPMTTATTEPPPWLRPSARLRILGWILVLTAVAVVGSLLLTRRLLLERLDGDVNDHLQQEVEELRRLSGGRDPATGEAFGDDAEAIFSTFLRRNVPAEGEAYYAFVGDELIGASQAPADLGADPAAGGLWARLTSSATGELDSEAGRVRWVALPLVGTDGEARGVFVVANFLQGERDEIAAVITTGLSVGAAILVVAALVGWVVAGRILRPVREVTETARAISESDLTGRIDAEGNDEVAELARTFNAMLDRLQQAFSSQRAFVDDAGHELRTPITIVRGHLELLGDDPDERRETVALVTDELDRMARIVDDMLLLAKLEQPDVLRPEAVEAEPFTTELFAKARALADRRWVLGEAAPVALVADPQRLTQAVMNLARNAVEHAGPDATITLGSSVDGGDIGFWVADTGAGIAPEDHEAIFERFARGGDRRRRSEGAGLGLAIAAAVAEAHDGHLTVASDAGAGATFRLSLPPHPSPADPAHAA
jgi:two-component system, OmpR family, sensor kinase